MQKHNHSFGEKIRGIREKRGLTMKEVAASAGVSESLISQIERNKVSPALNTLLAIVEVLEIDIEYLFADFRRERPVKLVKAKDRRRTETPKALYEHLSDTAGIDPEHGIEAYLLTIPPGGETGSAEYGHVGQELGFIIEGTAEFSIGARKYPLEEGDSISFSSDAPHRLVNTGMGLLRAFWAVTPPRGE